MQAAFAIISTMIGHVHHSSQWTVCRQRCVRARVLGARTNAQEALKARQNQIARRTFIFLLLLLIGAYGTYCWPLKTSLLYQKREFVENTNWCLKVIEGLPVYLSDHIAFSRPACETYNFRRRLPMCSCMCQFQRKARSQSRSSSSVWWSGSWRPWSWCCWRLSCSFSTETEGSKLPSPRPRSTTWR